jgi:hypothetical protein
LIRQMKRGAAVDNGERYELTSNTAKVEMTSLNSHSAGFHSGTVYCGLSIHKKRPPPTSACGQWGPEGHQGRGDEEETPPKE